MSSMSKSEGRNFMTFTIDADNNITVLASSQQIEEREAGTETFSSPHELAALAVQWPGSRLVEIWNSLPGVGPVERFTSRQVAATRIWKAIQQPQPTAGARRRQVAPKKASARNKASRRARPAGRKNTKTAKVIALLQQPDGATLRAIMRATGWQTHSVRGFVSGQLKKKLGLKVRSSQRDGERVYSIKR
jgi:Protein of unknown function (DUF3489)